MEFQPRLSLLFLVAATMAGCFSPPPDNDADSPGAGDASINPLKVTGDPGGAGGSGANVPPSVLDFQATPTLGDNSGAFTLVFSARVLDPNSERDLVRASLAATGSASLSFSREISGTDLDAVDEPTGFGADGWKVWTGSEKRDGILFLKFQYTYAQASPAGSYAWALTMLDKKSLTGTSDVLSVVVEASSLVEVSNTPVQANGSPDFASGWGNWSAVPGQSQVASANYLVVENRGVKTDARVVIDFDSSAFVGEEDSNFAIPIDGNVQFAWFEPATPEATRPSEGSFQFLPVSSQGAVTVSFSDANRIIYVQYRLISIPSVLPAQDYRATFTVTEL